MAAVTILSDFGAQENKVCRCFHFFPSVCHKVMGLDSIILVFQRLDFKPACPLSSCFHSSPVFREIAPLGMRVLQLDVSQALPEKLSITQWTHRDEHSGWVIVIFSCDVYTSLPPLPQAPSSSDTQAQNALALCLVLKELTSQGLAQRHLPWMPFTFALRGEDVTPAEPFSQLFNGLGHTQNMFVFSLSSFLAGSMVFFCPLSFWLYWVFAQAFSVAASGAALLMWATGFPLRWLLLWTHTLGAQASVVATNRLITCSSWTLEHRLGSCGTWA